MGPVKRTIPYSMVGILFERGRTLPIGADHTWREPASVSLASTDWHSDSQIRSVRSIGTAVSVARSVRYARDLRGGDRRKSEDQLYAKVNCP